MPKTQTFQVVGGAPGGSGALKGEPETGMYAAGMGRDDRPGHPWARGPHAPTIGAPFEPCLSLYSILHTRYSHIVLSTKPLSLRASSYAPCPLEGFAFAYFPTVGAGISFALAAPMATIFSIIA